MSEAAAAKPQKRTALRWTRHAMLRMQERYGVANRDALHRVEAYATRGFDTVRRTPTQDVVKACVQMPDGPLWLIVNLERCHVITVYRPNGWTGDAP